MSQVKIKAVKLVNLCFLKLLYCVTCKLQFSNHNITLLPILLNFNTMHEIPVYLKNGISTWYIHPSY